MAEPGGLEVAHVLFMDIVEFTLLPMAEQARQVRELQALLTAAAEYKRAEYDGALKTLPTGDGFALVFLRDPAAPAKLALELDRSLLQHPGVRLRMGIHSGPVSSLMDINRQANYTGGGMNGAQRVMDCGDAGHILVSGVAADLLTQLGEWEGRLHDLGECEVKHGAKVRLFNLFTEDAGNRELPQKLQSTALPPAQREEFELGAPLEAEGGAMPLDSRFYIERKTDREFCTAFKRSDSIILVKGPRQIGKTSLLARGLQQAREDGARVVLTDFQKLTPADLESTGSLFLSLAQALADQLDLTVQPDEAWNPRRGPNANFERYLRREALEKIDGQLVWGLDEVDRLFPYPHSSEVFALFRSWHNERSLDPASPWKRFTMAMAYATEAHLFITDLNQSPFNVGTRLTLEDFRLEEVSELNRRYGSPLRDDTEVARYYELVGGHPFLVRRGLHEMASHGMEIETLRKLADTDDGPFGDHLHRLLVSLTSGPPTPQIGGVGSLTPSTAEGGPPAPIPGGGTGNRELVDAMRKVLRGDPCPTPESFYRLRSAGVLAGPSAREARPRCAVYRAYLEKRLP